MTNQLLDLYTDYLISSFSFTTATGLSSALDGAVSHDKVTRFLSGENFDSKTLWKTVKPLIRSNEAGVIAIPPVRRKRDKNNLLLH